MNVRITKLLVTAAVTAVSAATLTGCAGGIGFITNATFIPADQSGPVVRLTASGDLPPAFEFPAGRAGTLELEFAGPYDNGTGLGDCTVTWANVGTTTATPNARNNAYVFSYALPGGVSVGTSSAALDCTVATGDKSGTKYTAAFVMRGVYDYVYWTTGTGVGRARISDPSRSEPGFITGLSEVKALSLYGDKIYFSNSKGIGRADLDGTNVEANVIPLDRSPAAFIVYGGGGSYLDVDTDGNERRSATDRSPFELDGFGQAQVVDALATDGNTWFKASHQSFGGKPWLNSPPTKVHDLNTPPANGLSLVAGVPYWTNGGNISRFDKGFHTETVVKDDGELLGLGYDGRRLLAVRKPSGGGAQIIAMDIDGSKVEVLLDAKDANGGLTVGGGWSPTPRVRVLDRDGKPASEITMPAYGSPDFPVGNPINFSVNNYGNAQLQLTGCSIVEGDQALFSIVANPLCSGFPVLQGNTYPVNVRFTPGSTSGTYRAVVRLTGNINPRGYIDVPITTSWTAPTPSPSGSPSPSPAPVFSVAPSSHDFGTHAVGYPSEYATFTITNAGTAPMTIPAGGVTLAGTNKDDYDLVPGACDEATLAPAQSCTLEVLFSPVAAVGTSTAQLQLVTNATGSPHTVALTGNAVAPALSFAPDPVPTLDVELGRPPATGQIILTNDSTQTVGIATVNLTGADSAKFTLEAGTSCTAGPLPAAASCMIEYSFGPTGIDPTGDYTAAVLVTHNGAGSPLEIPITGNATPPVGP